MKYIFVILYSLILISCNDNKTKKDTNKLIQELESKINNEICDADIDKLGNFKIDMGSASTGRVSGNLSDVFITMEILPKRPGCADICPEMAVIHFKCENDKKCITDPAFTPVVGYYNEGVITFENLDKAKEVYDLLNKIKNSF